MPENYFPPLGTPSGEFSRYDAEQLLKYRAFQQQPEVYVAADDTSEQLAYMAKYKCDGIDDQATIQEAYDDGFSVVKLLPGTFEIEEALQVTTAGAVLLGSGDTTVLNLGAFSVSNQAIRLTGSNAQLSSLKIDGTNANSSVTGVISMPTGTVTDVLITDFVETTPASVIVDAAVAINCRLDDCKAVSGFRGGKLLYCQVHSYTGTYDFNLQGMADVAFGCYSNLSSATASAFVQGGNSHVENCWANTCGAPIAFEVDASNAVCVNNTVEGCDFDGIVIKGDDNVVHGNIVDRYSQDTATTYDGIKLTSTADENSVQNNVVRESAVTAGRYGIRIDAGATDNLVRDNYANGSTANVSDAGTGTRRETVRQAIKSADESRTSTTTLTDDSELVLALSQSKRYAVEATIFWTHNSTPDIKVSMLGPTAATVRLHAAHGVFGAVRSAAFGQTVSGALNIIIASSGTRFIRYVGYIETSTTSGNISFRWAQNTSSGTAITVLKGSYLRIIEEEL